ncbi:hypothetical protein XOCgx_0689 [Xanthomonas oryzae pv. oryzicola]|nr:hypothetical protein XOCgx_0689 [Xanthomonas oryzae pv. oryzicola]
MRCSLPKRWRARVCRQQRCALAVCYVCHSTTHRRALLSRDCMRSLRARTGARVAPIHPAKSRFRRCKRCPSVCTHHRQMIPSIVRDTHMQSMATPCHCERNLHSLCRHCVPTLLRTCTQPNTHAYALSGCGRGAHTCQFVSRARYRHGPPRTRGQRVMKRSCVELMSPNPQLDFCFSSTNSVVFLMFSMMCAFGVADARSWSDVISARTSS